MTEHDLSDVPTIRTGEKGAVFVVRGDLTRVDADAYVVPTDSNGTVEDTWRFLVGVDERGDTRQLWKHQGEPPR